MSGKSRTSRSKPDSNEKAPANASPDLSILDGGDGSGGWDPSKPIGKGNPPRANSWKKGGPSPNPRGAPRKRDVGPFFNLLNQTIKGTTLTHREALDKKVLELSVGGNVKAVRLYKKRIQREQKIEKLRTGSACFEQRRSQALQPHSTSRMKEGVFRKIGEAVDRAKPGLLDSLAQLTALGAIEMRDGRLVIAASLEPFL